MNPGELRTQLPRFERRHIVNDVKPLYQLSSAAAVWRLCWSWIWVSAAVTVVLLVDHWTAYVPALMIIPGRQVGLAFMVHEAAHLRLFKRKTLSDRVVNLLAGFPLGLTVQFYRRHHIAHHVHLNTPGDPDWPPHQHDYWRWPRTRPQAAGHLGKSLMGWHGIRWLTVWRAMAPWHRFRDLERFDQVSFLLLSTTLAASLTLLSGWTEFLILWVLPQFTLTFFLHELRTIAEHLALDGTHELNASRTVVSSPLERFLVAPFGVNYHLEHHLFPGVPAHNLHKVHRLLMRDDTFRTGAHITRSYFGRRGLLSEVIHSKPATATL